MTRRILDLGRQLQYSGWDAVIGLVGGGRDIAPRIDLLAPRILLPGGIAEGLGHVAHRRPGPIGDDVGDLRGVMPAVPLVHVLDDLFAPVTLDVDVDVGRPIALGRQEPLEQQSQRHRVGLGDAERITRRAVGRAATTLTEDVGPVAELDEIPHHQEVAGEPEVLDHVEFVVDGAPCPGTQRQVFVGGWPLAVPTATTLLDELAQVLHLGQRRARAVGVARAWERRQVWSDQGEIECRCPADLGGHLDHTGVAQEPAGLLGAAAQVGAGRCRKPRVELVEAAPGAHRGDGRGQLALRWRGVVHVVGGYAGQVVTCCQFGKGIVARCVERIAVVPQFDHDPVTPEQIDQTLQLPRSCRGTVVDQCRGHGTLAATGEHPTVTGHRIGDVERA